MLDAAGNVTAAAITGPDGTYALEDLPTGGYTVIASGYSPVATSLWLSPGLPQAYDIRLAHPQG